jgi:hypothetical protein
MRENEKVLVLSREKEWGRSSRVGEKEERDRRERERDEMRRDVSEEINKTRVFIRISGKQALIEDFLGFFKTLY